MPPMRGHAVRVPNRDWSEAMERAEAEGQIASVVLSRLIIGWAEGLVDLPAQTREPERGRALTESRIIRATDDDWKAIRDAADVVGLTVPQVATMFLAAYADGRIHAPIVEVVYQ